MEFLGAKFDKDLKEMSTKALAYVGDSVFELFCRVNYSFDNKEVVARVNAQAQARCYDRIKSMLTQEEKEVARRGRNLKTPRSKEPSYRKATALESLVGYLFLAGRIERLAEILKECEKTKD